MSFRIITGDSLDVLRGLAPASVHCCVTSPPYWGLRDYKADGQLGLERTPEEYVARLVAVFRAVRRVLRPDGTLWLNLGDSYAAPGGGYSPNAPSNIAGSKQSTQPHAMKSIKEHIDYGLKPKNLVGIPWRVAFALQADGWYLRSDIIWAKPNPMPESVTDRPTKAHEYIFLLAQQERYYYDADAIADEAVQSSGGWQSRAKNGLSTLGANSCCNPDRNDSGACVGEGRIGATRNKRTVWTVASSPYPDAHFATFPPALIEPCILAGCPEDGTVLDPFAGAGTTGLVALRHGRRFLGVELNPEYCRMARWRIQDDAPLFNIEECASS